MAFEIQEGFAPFYEHARQGQLCFPRCEDCGRYHWYPMKRCPYCRSDRLAWSPVKGPGHLYTWTRVHHPFEPSLANDLPYVVALIDFEDAPGIRYVSNVVDIPPEKLKIGMALKPVFPEPGAAVPAVRFRPA
jgi:uncharacterized OB-fold protein